MPDERNWIWIEKIFKLIPIPYPVTSLILAGLIILIFWFFSMKVLFFPWDFFNQLTVSSLSILIAFQLIGIQYVLNDMKKTFREMKSYPENKEKMDELYGMFQQSFDVSYKYYIIIGAVIIPFVLIDVLGFLKGESTFFSAEPTKWSFFLDIFTIITGFIMLFLLAIILWLMSNILWMLNKIGNEPYNYFIKIDIFNIDRMGGLKPISSFLLNVLVFYSLCLTLAIVSYVSPFSIFSYESFFLIILLLIGVSFFLMGLMTVRKLLRSRIEEEINKINERYQLEHQRLLEFDSKGNYKDKTEELQLVSTTLETLYNERERIIQLYADSKGYDLMTIAKSISSFIPPVIAFIQKFIDVGVEIKKFLF